MIFVKLIANIFSYCAKPCRRSDVFDWISIFLFLYHSYSILSPLSLSSIHTFFLFLLLSQLFSLCPLHPLLFHYFTLSSSLYPTILTLYLRISLSSLQLTLSHFSHNLLNSLPLSLWLSHFPNHFFSFSRLLPVSTVATHSLSESYTHSHPLSILSSIYPLTRSFSLLLKLSHYHFSHSY